MASVTQIRPQSKRREALTPELRAFIDRAVVPILVREFLVDQKMAVVTTRSEVVESGATSATAEGVE
jgi:hypothetical protein